MFGDKKKHLAETVSMEMGKPIRESTAEVDKSIGMIDYLIDSTPEFMKDEPIKTKLAF